MCAPRTGSPTANVKPIIATEIPAQPAASQPTARRASIADSSSTKRAAAWSAVNERFVGLPNQVIALAAPAKASSAGAAFAARNPRGALCTWSCTASDARTKRS